MNGISPLRWVYLALAVGGAIVPTYFFTEWFNANGWSLAGLTAEWRANDATRGLLWDLMGAVTAFFVWVIAETRVRRNWLALVVLPVTFLIGFACALPLYLFLRTRRIA